MADYIEREAVVMGILGLTIVDPMVAQYADAVLRQIQQVPAADVAPVVHGRWIKSKKEKMYCDWEMNGWFDYPEKCSCCGYDATEYGMGEGNYCPRCGAKMDKEH